MFKIRALKLIKNILMFNQEKKNNPVALTSKEKLLITLIGFNSIFYYLWIVYRGQIF